jgi:hypothetical protein
VEKKGKIKLPGVENWGRSPISAKQPDWKRVGGGGGNR